MPTSSRHAASFAHCRVAPCRRVSRFPRLLPAPAFAPVSVTPLPQLHRVPLLVRAEKALNVVINKDEEAIRYDEKAYYLQAQGFYRIVKYLKAACVTAVPPSTPAKPRLGRPPRSAGGPAAGGSDSEE